MSLRDLVESDCGGSNSLVKLSTHLVQDHAFKDQDLIQSTHNENNDQIFLQTNTRELADQFFSSVETETFKMDNILAEMRSVEADLGSSEEAWPTEFAKKIDKHDQQFDPNIWSSSENKMLVKDEVYDLGYTPEWVQEIEQSYENQKNNVNKSRFDFDRNKEKVLEFDDFESITRDDFMDVNRKVSYENNFHLPINNLGIGLFHNPILADNQEYRHDIMAFENTFQSTETNNASSTMSPSTPGIENILVRDQFEQFKQLDRTIENVDPSSMKNEYFNYNPVYGNTSRDIDIRFDSPSNYSFTPGNEMESIENPLAEGKRRLENGELPTAVLCFEAAVKQDPSNAEAWQLLGTTQAENEQDHYAIQALKKCIELQPENLNAMLCLAACYTNESSHTLACQTLKDWLYQNPKYRDIVESKPIPKITPYLLSSSFYDNVKEMYIEAAQRSLETGNVDADVQNGLGVLLNLNNENDKAVDCFKAALQIRPEDARLWNRLGATLANGGRCEEAIEAYHNALQLCPGFVRARYNLGITCIHLDTYREAIEHLLEALNQQASAISAKFQTPALSDTIWSTLRLAISMEELPELLKAVNDRNLDLLNEKFNYNGADRGNVTPENE
ncbi:peroxisomal targeting signal 1 receptor isoform X1 [Sipha flava]|uniref:Peroxisomal targeting signal 1 receptor n=1 Tax=Sipha flava TaxID=143950 RepID=A0A2S2Q0F7_9HEMI|nr:peroxisomal targeting signal 1 receptor isoform X1 [Sipha flava]